MDPSPASPAAAAPPPTPADLVPRMADRRGRRPRPHELGAAAHLAPGFDVRDVLEVVGATPIAHERPVVTVSLCDLPHDAQRRGFAELMSWPGAHLQLKGMRGDRCIIRFSDRPQLNVTVLLEAVCEQVEAAPQRQFVWAVRKDLLP